MLEAVLKAGLTLRLDQVAQHLIQLHFEYLPGWTVHNIDVPALVLTIRIENNSSSWR